MSSAAVYLTDAAATDLLGFDAQTRRTCVAKMSLLMEDPAVRGEPLVGALIGFRKLVFGRSRSHRITYRVTEDGDAEIVEVWALGKRHRSEVYRELEDRIQQSGSPQLIALSELLTGAAPVPEGPSGLDRKVADHLVYVVGFSLDEVLAMSDDEAWARYDESVSQPNMDD